MVAPQHDQHTRDPSINTGHDNQSSRTIANTQHLCEEQKSLDLLLVVAVAPHNSIHGCRTPHHAILALLMLVFDEHRAYNVQPRMN